MTRKTTAAALGTLVFFLLVGGVVMLSSTSSVRAAADFGDPHYFLKRQGMWLVIAIAAGLIVSRIDYRGWRKMAPILFGLSVVFLVAVLLVGRRVGGSVRWLSVFGFMSVQPSEPAKFGMVVALCAWISRFGDKSESFGIGRGFLVPIAIVGAVAGLILREPDLGTAFLVGAVGMLVMFLGGVKTRYLLLSAAFGLIVLGVMLWLDPLRWNRIEALFFPDRFPGTSYHLAQSKLAFRQGGLLGVGIGNSIQKQFFLPEAHTDFILPIIGEELGLFGSMTVVVLFAGILLCGLQIAARAPDRFGRLLAIGLTALLTLQAGINMGVVTGCLPTKGLPLPFVSYGGSSLVMSVVSVCVLINIAGHCPEAEREQKPIPLARDRLHII